jgi:prepilin-type N-terminal cleavage/methylation domain-containing protein
MKNHKKRKGFTLIELLVVIAIIAILAVVVVLTLNPAELLRQARDSNRLSDFATLKSALSLYSTDVVTTTPLFNQTIGFTLYTANPSLGASTTDSDYEGPSSWGFVSGIYTGGTANGNVSQTSSRAVDGTGWIPVDLDAISSGAPIGVLPVDPVNSGNNMYLYAGTSTVFKLATQMESVKYSYDGPSNVESTDGGNSTSTYEQGTDITTL